MMSAKAATPSLLKIRVFWNNDYDVIVSVHDVTSKTLQRDSNFGNCSIAIRRVIITSIL